MKKPKKCGTVTSTTWEDALNYTARDMAHLSKAQRSHLSKSEYRHLYRHYQVTLSPHRVPPRVAKLSAKKLKYKQRIADRIESADRMLMEMDMNVPTVEELMSCPLAKYIHLASNNTNYSGSTKELIANYVHPLFHQG